MTFFFHHTATSDIYTLSLHDALPICSHSCSARCSRNRRSNQKRFSARCAAILPSGTPPDRKSTRLNSSHTVISYAVFCLKKKKRIKKVHELSVCRTWHGA